MSKITSFFKQSFAALLSSFKSRPEINVPKACIGLPKTLRLISNKAYPWGYRGNPNTDPLIQEANTAVDKVLKNATNQVKRRIEPLKTRAKAVARNKREFNSQSGSAITKKKSNDSVRIDAEVRLTEATSKTAQARSADVVAETNLHDKLQKYGSSQITLALKVGLAFTLSMLALFDIPFSGPVMVLLKVPPILAWSSAVIISIVIAKSAHGAAKAFVAGYNRVGILWLIVGGGAIFCIGIMRMVDGTGLYALVSLVFLLLFYLAALLSSYVYCGRGEVANDKRTKQKTAEALRRCVANETKAFATLQAIKNRESEDFIAWETDSKAALQNEEDALSVQIVEGETDIKSITDFCETARAETLANIATEYERGRNARDMGGPLLRKVVSILFVAALITSNGCGELEPDPVWYESNAMVEMSMSAELTEDGLADHILFEFANLDEEFDGCRGVKVNLTVFGEPSAPKTTTMTLQPGAALYRRIVPDREDTIARYVGRVTEGINQTFATPPSLPYSNLYRGSAQALNRLARSSSNYKEQIIVSDFIEEGESVDFSDYLLNPEKLREDYDKIKKKLLADTPLGELSGINVYLLCQPKLPFHSSKCKTTSQHTDECRIGNAALAHEGALVFKKIFEEHGAFVDVIHNF